MKGSSRIRRVRHGLLGLIFVLLALAVASWFLTGEDMGRTPLIAIQELPVPELDDTSYVQAALERPVFWASRRPVQVEIVDDTPEPEVLSQPLGDIKLLAVMTSGEQGTAVVSAGGKALTVRPGSVVNGWNVERIDPQAVYFASGTEQAAVEIVRTLHKGVKLN
ncbi:MAG: hypothetical protein QMB92_06425 [Thiopseudomonas sp.]